MNPPSPQTAALPTPIVTPMRAERGVWTKLERQQLTGSVKYRMVHAKLTAAIAAGELHSGATLVEATAGSTGVALAFAAQALGLRALLHVYASADPAKCERIRAFGGVLKVHPDGTPFPTVFAEIADAVHHEGAWHLNQYDRTSTTASYEGLATEIVSQLEGQTLETFACAVGTGGLIQGVGKALRRTFPKLRIVCIEPAPGQTIDGIRNTQINYLGPNDPYDRTFPEARFETDAPTESAIVADRAVGQSATAMLNVVRAHAWRDTLVIAPD